jgi:CYTH domain-containing protein
MPTENERKFVLSDADAVRALWDRADWSEIRQGYLRGDARVRRQTRGGVAHDSFTYKIAAAGRLIEIETVLAEPRDFDDLWPLTTRRIHKLRRSETDRHGLHWDIDLLMGPDGAVYFAMAECEMPEAMDAPPEILPALAPHIAYAVPRERQAEFLNSRLADPTWAAALSF